MNENHSIIECDAEKRIFFIFIILQPELKATILAAKAHPNNCVSLHSTVASAISSVPS